MHIETVMMCAGLVLATSALGQQAHAVPQAAADVADIPVSVIPVLVTVSADGKATGVVPAYRLRPNIQRLIESTIFEMVRGPAFERGKPITSQVVIKLKLHPERRDDGTYLLSFDLGGVESLPYGAWRWITDGQGKLRMVNSALTPRDDPLQHRFNTSVQEIFNPNPHGLD